MLYQELCIILITYLIMLWSMVVIMFGYKHVEILLENVDEILVVITEYGLVCRVLQLYIYLWTLTLERLNFMLVESFLWFMCWVVIGSLVNLDLLILFYKIKV